MWIHPFLTEFLIMKTKKDFDCVQYVHKERKRIAQGTKDKTPKEILAYFKKQKKNVN